MLVETTMSPIEGASTLDQPAGRRFASFAVLDLETANLPEYNYNKVGITELSIYGFALEELENTEVDVGSNLPKLPRRLHKLSLMYNPRMAITPIAERVTGLNNFMLEEESTFNENAATTFLGFLKHLRQPVCLVAHNGWRFDFPIIRHVLEKVQMDMPNVFCVDSLRAFHDIDLKRAENKVVSEESEETKVPESSDLETILQAEKDFDARAKNETTPKRPTISAATAAVKRKSNVIDDEADENGLSAGSVAPKSKRALNFGESFKTPTAPNLSYQMPRGKKWYPPKDIYKLGNIYRRTFLKDPVQAHYAEADVLTLTHLMLHYGEDFISYAECQARAFESIPRLGKNNL